jgi:hypothetical protein
VKKEKRGSQETLVVLPISRLLPCGRSSCSIWSSTSSWLKDQLDDVPFNDLSRTLSAQQTSKVTMSATEVAGGRKEAAGGHEKHLPVKGNPFHPPQPRGGYETCFFVSKFESRICRRDTLDNA